MTCKMDEELLYSYADETIEELEKIFVEEHLKYCNHCNKKLELIKFTDRELKQLDIGLIPTGRLRIISDLVIENCLAKVEEESTGLKLHNYIQNIRKLQNVAIQSGRMYKNNPYERFLTGSINKVSNTLVTPAKSYVKEKIGTKLLKLVKVG